MAESGHRKTISHRKTKGIRRVFCCRFGIPPKSPEFRSKSPPPPHKSSLLTSPPTTTTTRSTLGRVGFDRRRILSPGRVSPIDTETPTPLDQPLREMLPPELNPSSSFHPSPPPPPPPVAEKLPETKNDERSKMDSGVYDVRLSLKGKNGARLVLELDSKVLAANSSVFANLISESQKKSSASVNFCRIEVPDVENLTIFHDTIGLMFQEDITTSLVKMGVSRSIDVLEVAAGIMFTKGVMSCLKYLEAVPWNEGEEEKLKSLFTRFTFDDTTTKDVLARLAPPEETSSQQQLVMQLVHLVTNGSDDNSRSELKSLVTSLVSRSSVYEKDLDSLKKEDLYVVTQSCLGSLVALFKEAASDCIPKERSMRVQSTSKSKPLIERISKQVDNINWLLEIMVDQQMAEEFVDVWANQGELLRMHGSVSPMVRYEVSRISAWVFVALGTRKLHCRSDTRCGVLAAWFVPMLVDFGWLQRCKKGLDIKELEEAMGQALLTLPLKHQQFLFMEWFHSFSRHGTECPNLSKAFQIWWRRSSLTRTFDSR